MFEFIMGEKEIPEEYERNERTAVRAILFYGDKLLMVKNNRGDYKFPGGGVEPGEGQEKALLREIAEETGYLGVKVGEKLGEVIQQRPDNADISKYFVMKSIYYLCELENLTNYGLKLDDYEEEQGFHGEFVKLSDALEANLGILKSDSPGRNDWVERETEVLKYLLTY